MGECARLHILETYGVDIGDDDDHPRQRPKPVFRCACGKPFSTILGRDQHMAAHGSKGSCVPAQETQTTKDWRHTMKVRTSDLIGPALNWAVAVAEKHTIMLDGTTVYIDGPRRMFDPCNDYLRQGGTIIEREGISVKRRPKREREPGFLWVADLYTDIRACPSEFELGPTFLIAAMRVYVAIKLGEVVDLPEVFGNMKFGYRTSEPCVVCGGTAHTQTDPRFGFSVCLFHQDHHPVTTNCHHTLYTTQDADRPPEICDKNGEVVLSMCKKCGAAESELYGKVHHSG